jgi:hypothetical protein
MRWMTAFIAACCLLAADAGARAAAPAAVAHARRGDDAACLRCHAAARGVLTGAMATRAGERAFARRAFGHDGDRFFDGACAGCHVSSCRDCHGEGTAMVARPPDEACLRCHRGYFVGWDYHGRAAREDHERYQRGAVAQGERVLKMRPDVHQEAGLMCADCHSMASLQAGRRASRTCTDCHPKPSLAVPEHAIAAHLEKMECWACHSAWASQEYGTFLVRPRTDEQREAFEPLPAWGEWRKSAWLKRQDAPPLGLDARGKVSPIRPQFTLFATDPSRGWENRRLALEWRPFVPHTIRRGTVACGGCHGDARRFLLEEPRARVQRPDEDGLPLRSFFDRAGQTVTGGAFFPAERYRVMNRRTPTYVREHLRRWQDILDHVGPSSAR